MTTQGIDRHQIQSGFVSRRQRQEALTACAANASCLFIGEIQTHDIFINLALQYVPELHQAGDFISRLYFRLV